MSKEAMKLALKALKHIHPSPLTSFYTIGDRDKAIKALEEALAKQEQLCRSDGRCQYAIDSGAEGMGHCPKGKCVMPAKQEQGEPVAWMRTSGRGSPVVSTEYLKAFPEMIGYFDLPLYTTPQQRTWVGLTDEEIRACIASNKYAFEIVRAAEAKLKEKNT